MGSSGGAVHEALGHQKQVCAHFISLREISTHHSLQLHCDYERKSVMMYAVTILYSIDDLSHFLRILTHVRVRSANWTWLKFQSPSLFKHSLDILLQNLKGNT